MSLPTEFSVRDDAAWASPTVGVIGGNGPAATALFQDVLVRMTPAHRDQDHLDLVVLVHSSQPDRTAHILDAKCAGPGGCSPGTPPDSTRSAPTSRSSPATPRTTSSRRSARPRRSRSSIVEETAKAAVAAAATDGARIGVLATDGTRAAGVYDRVIDGLGATPVFPDAADQALTMSVIYDGVKAGGPIDLPGLEGVMERLLAVSDVVVLGCTELSVIHAAQGVGRPPADRGLDRLPGRSHDRGWRKSSLPAARRLTSGSAGG